MNQVFNKFANDVIADVLEFSLFVSVIVLILGIFRFSGVIVPLFASVGSIIGIVHIPGLGPAVTCHFTSDQVCQMHKQTLKPQGRYERLFWKSRKPLTMRVDRHFALKSKHYVVEKYGDVVLKTAIDLLVTFQ